MRRPLGWSECSSKKVNEKLKWKQLKHYRLLPSPSHGGSHRDNHLGYQVQKRGTLRSKKRDRTLHMDVSTLCQTSEAHMFVNGALKQASNQFGQVSSRQGGRILIFTNYSHLSWSFEWLNECFWYYRFYLLQTDTCMYKRKQIPIIIIVAEDSKDQSKLRSQQHLALFERV